MQWLLPALFVRRSHAQPSHAGSVRGETHFARRSSVTDILVMAGQGIGAQAAGPTLTMGPEVTMVTQVTMVRWAMEHPMTCRRPYTPGQAIPLRPAHLL